MDWLPKINLLEDDPLLAEARAVEYSRSFTLYCLHESILKYGQDFKNKQWVIEPISNMVIALSLMDTGYKRYMQLENGRHKSEARDVLKLSIADQFDICNKCGIIANKVIDIDLYKCPLCDSNTNISNIK